MAVPVACADLSVGACLLFRQPPRGTTSGPEQSKKSLLHVTGETDCEISEYCFDGVKRIQMDMVDCGWRYQCCGFNSRLPASNSARGTAAASLADL